MTTSLAEADDPPMETKSSHGAAPDPSPTRRGLGSAAYSTISTVVLVLLFVVFAEIGSRVGWWSDHVLSLIHI